MAVDTGEVHQLAERRTRDADRLYTKGRREIVELLASIGRPVTMQELVDRSPRLNLGSLYRNMTDLEAIGIVQKVLGAEGPTRYELAERLIGHHHHSICSVCGAVGDFTVPARSERSLEVALERALAPSGFRPTGHRLDVIGVCATCVS